MASDEFHALAERMAAAPAPPPDETLPQQRARIDGVMSQIPLATGTVAVEGTIGAVPAIECRPQPLEGGETTRARWSSTCTAGASASRRLWPIGPTPRTWRR